MSPSSDNNDSLNSIGDDQLGSHSNRRVFQFENFHISRHFNPSGTRFFSLESDGSTISTDDSGSLNAGKLSEHFQYGPKWTSTTSKKYSLHYVPNTDIQKLITEFDSILDKVEERQNRAAGHVRNNRPSHWNAIVDAVEKKQQCSKPYLSHMYPNMAEFKKAAGTFEEQIIRKQAYTTGRKPASHREWRILYAVLKDNTLSFYKDVNYRRNEIRYHGEQALKIDGGVTAIETSSKKRRYLIRLKLSDGSEYILQCQNVSDWARWLAELNVTIKRYSPHTTVTTPFGSSLPDSPFKSNVSTAPSTPLFPKHIILTVKESDKDLTTQVHQSIIETESNQVSAKAEIHQPPVFIPVVNGFVEKPHPQVLAAGLASINSVINNIESQREEKTDANNNDYVIVLDDYNENDSML